MAPFLLVLRGERMSYWSARSLGRERDYIVLKHPTKGINTTVSGVKFRDSYAVVEKDSKVYYQLKRMPQLRASREFPLIFLEKLPFVITPIEVKYVYGADVYNHFMIVRDEELKKRAEIQKEVSEESHVEELKKCAYRTKVTGELCKYNALDESPSAFCMRHLLEDPELGIDIPQYMSKRDRKELAKRVFAKIKIDK